MVKHLLFYDEPEAISAKLDAADGVDDGNDANGVGFFAGGTIASLRKNRKKDKTLKWMGLLFLSTLLLLIFQLLLGWSARAVSLLADSGHSAADVISYGFNLLIEWMKLAPALGTPALPGTFTREVTPRKVESDSKKLDMLGSLFSLVILLSATWFSTQEAIARLRVPSEEESGNIGRALLAYAIVSTAVSIGILVMYRRWHGKGAQKTGGSNSANLHITQEAFTAIRNLPFCPRCKNQSISNSGQESAPSQVSDSPTDAPSQSEEVALALHMLIHPGCTCSSADIVDYVGSVNFDVEVGSEVAVAEKSGRQEVLAPGSKASRNLNLVATILHVITDLLRSVTILFVAILIQLEAIQDAEYGDAVCGLVVAFLILIGSMALLLQVTKRLYACCKRKGYTAQPEPTKRKDEIEAQTEPGKDEERI